MMIYPALRLLSGLALLVPALALPACAGNRAEANSDDSESRIEVQNQGFPDMTIYAITAGGSRVRLGLVNGHSTQRLRLPSHLVGGGQQLRFLADPIGGARTPVSHEFFVAPGDVVTLIIPPQ
ncbi:MAG: hypothetical protein H0V43_08915 [Gemmatimonadales bacterium]|nr:hypothetical protein [Gemmatimonadales bacterium]